MCDNKHHAKGYCRKHYDEYIRIRNNKEVKEYFKQLNIPYEKLDPEMINVIYKLNKLDIKTRNCCIGHNKFSFYIQFQSDLEDNKIYNLMENLMKIEYKDNTIPRFEVKKWGRKLDNKMQYHWCLKLYGDFSKLENNLIAIKDICKVLNNYKIMYI